MSGMRKQAKRGTKKLQTNDLRTVCLSLKCPEWRAVSGFPVPKKHHEKANDLIGSTSKPDRITEGQRGWNLEPVVSGVGSASIAVALQLSCSAVAEKPPCKPPQKAD